MIAIGRLFRAVLDGRMEAEEALTRLAALTPGASFANGFFRGAAGVEALGALAAAE